MNIRFDINIDNAAFGDTRIEKEAEIKRVFEFYINSLDLSHPDGMGVKDINGNTVGLIESS
jgi:hypothetical protein